MSNPELRLRPASESDMAGVFEIHKYYTLQTVITFKTVVTSKIKHVENLRSVQSQRLPYIVALLPSSERDETTGERVVGYIYCSGFRSGKSGYLHTVELSLFCHPENLSQGIGTLLLKKLLAVLARPEENKEWYEGGNARSEDDKVRQVLAVMALDETARDGGYGLKQWYERFGFEEVGHLKKVGRKFDRW